MPVRIAINGFGRIGRSIFRQCCELGWVDIVAINDVELNSKEIAYLASFDSVYGRPQYDIRKHNSSTVVCNDKHIQTYSYRGWGWLQELGSVDYVIDASGDTKGLMAGVELLKEIQAKILLTYHLNTNGITLDIPGQCEAPCESQFVSFSTCDAIALAPILGQLSLDNEIKHVEITTLHPFLNNQRLLDGKSPSDFLPLGRAAFNTLIPKTSSISNILIELFPSLNGHLGVLSFRVPTNAVTAAYINIQLANEKEGESPKEKLIERIASLGPRVGQVSYQECTSIDFCALPVSFVVDANWTKASGANVSILVWYDNEWGYASRVVDFIARDQNLSC